VSRKEDCLDNAVAERFFGSLKRERTAHCQYATRQEDRDDVIDYIEMFSHSTRLYSYLGYVSPNAYEALRKAASLSVRFSLTITWRHQETGEDEETDKTNGSDSHARLLGSRERGWDVSVGRAKGRVNHSGEQTETSSVWKTQPS
jgi:hypothetical protein